MRKQVLIIVGLCVLGIFFASFDFRNSDAGVQLYLQRVESYIGASFSDIESDLGSPDLETSDALVRTYYIKDKSGEITGYRQFGYWGDVIGCFSERNVIDEPQVMSLYERVLGFMREDQRTVGLVSMSENPYDFTENHRLSRRLDNMWEVDMLLRDRDSQISLYVYDHDKRACHLELLIEANRIEERLGL